MFGIIGGAHRGLKYHVVMVAIRLSMKSDDVWVRGRLASRVRVVNPIHGMVPPRKDSQHFHGGNAHEAIRIEYYLAD